DGNARELSVRRWTDGAVDVCSVNNTFRSCESYESSYANPAVTRVACELLDQWRPDVIHLQHLTCLSTGIPRQAARRGIPVVVTLNDYWLICHRGQLVDRDGRRCNGPEPDGCARCLSPAALATSSAFRAGRWLRAAQVPVAGAAVSLATRA